MARDDDFRAPNAPVAAPPFTSLAASLARVSILPLLTAALGGCTVVRVSDGQGVKTSYYPGVAVIRITPADSVQVVEVESLGASAVGNTATLGWSHNRVAIVPPGRCQLILWRPRTTELTELRGLLGPQNEVCDLEGEGQ